MHERRRQKSIRLRRRAGERFNLAEKGANRRSGKEEERKRKNRKKGIKNQRKEEGERRRE